MATSASTAASCRPAGLVSAAASRAVAQIVAPVPRVSTSHAATMTSAHSASFTASGLIAEEMKASIGVSRTNASSVPATSAGIPARRQATQTSAHSTATSAQVASR